MLVLAGARPIDWHIRWSRAVARYDTTPKWLDKFPNHLDGIFWLPGYCFHLSIGMDLVAVPSASPSSGQSRSLLALLVVIMNLMGAQLPYLNQSRWNVGTLW